ncbi:MAG: hypothetical protein ACP5JT_03830 [Thermoplasmata archaeon]|jgi:hypothetical protein
MAEDVEITIKKLIINMLEYSSDVDYLGIIGNPDANILKFKLKKYKKLNVEMYILVKIIFGELGNIEEIIDFARLCSTMDNIVDAMIFVLGNIKISLGEIDEDGFYNYKYGNICNIRIIDGEKFNCLLGEYIFEMLKIGKRDELDFLDKILSMQDEDKNEYGIPIIIGSINNDDNDRKLIKIKKSRAEVISNINDDIKNIKLIYYPYAFMNFKLEVLETGTINPIKYNGVVAVDLADYNKRYIIKNNVEIINERELDRKLLDFEIVEPESTDLDELKNIVVNFLIKEFTGDREEKREYEFATVVKTVHTTVIEDSISVDYIDTYYWPFWIVETSDEKITIDATNLI